MSAPNARIENEDGSHDYAVTAGALRIEYHATSSEKGTWKEFSPANLKVWFNDKEVLCDGLSLNIDKDGVPRCLLRFSLDHASVDIDALMDLQVMIREGMLNAQADQAEA